MAYAEITEERDRVLVQTTFAQKDMIKQVPGARWDVTGKFWHVPLSWAACVSLRGVFGEDLTVGPQLQAWAWAERQTRVDPAMALRCMTEPVTEVGGNLRPFQVVGVQFLMTAKRALLGDEMGTGKTIQLIETLKMIRESGQDDPFPVLVMCPFSVKGGWDKEWKKWDPKVTVIVIDGDLKNKRRLFDEAAQLIAMDVPTAVVINYEAALRHSRHAAYGNHKLSDKERQVKELNLLPFSTVIADEAHKLKDPGAKTTRTAWAVFDGPTVTRKYALTGTPIANHPGELWSVMRAIAPDEYPTKTAFVDRYCMQSWGMFGGLDIVGIRPDTKDEFYRFFDPRFRRMAKSLVLSQLPPKMRLTYEVEMGKEQAKAYREMASSMMTVLDDGSFVMATNNLAVNTRLLQFASSYATIDEEGNVRLTDPSAKLDAAMDLVKDEFKEEQIAISSESRQLINLMIARLEKAGITYRAIVGGMTRDARDQAMTDFQEGRARVILYTLKAGGTGITLTAASVGLCLQRSWSMVDNKQGEDRYHRIGSEIHDRILIVDFVTKGTIEETQIPRLHAKMERLQEITRDRDIALAAGDRDAVARYDSMMDSIYNTPLWADHSGSMEGDTTDD